MNQTPSSHCYAKMLINKWSDASDNVELLKCKQYLRAPAGTTRFQSLLLILSGTQNCESLTVENCLPAHFLWLLFSVLNLEILKR